MSNLRKAQCLLLGVAMATGSLLAGCGGGGSTDVSAVPQPAPVSPAPVPGAAPGLAPLPDRVVAPKTATDTSLVAGSLQRAGGRDGVGAEAQFNRPQGVAADRSGNIYVADTDNHTIRKLSPDGRVSTLAGTAGVSGSTDGGGATARFSSPQGIAVDAAGNVFVADTGNHAIRMISPAGMVTLHAGAPGETGDVDGRGSAARFDTPVKVAIDGRGNLLVVDRGNRKVRKISSSANVSTFWSDPMLDKPLKGVGADANGNLYIARWDYNYSSSILKVDSEGRELPWPDASNRISGFPFASDIAVRSDGAVYIASGGPYGCGRYPCYASSVRFVSPAGAVSPLAGNSSLGHVHGPGAQASFDMPLGIALTAGGRVIVADTENSAIREIDSQGVVTTLAGGLGRGSVDGTGASARFYNPEGIASGPDGVLYVADRSNRKVRRISSEGRVSTVLPLAADGSAQPLYGDLTGIAVDRQGTVYVSGYGSFYPPGSSNLYSITATSLTTLLRSISVQVVAPIAVDDSGNLYTLDFSWGGNDVISRGLAAQVLVPGGLRVLALAAGVGGTVYAATTDTVLAVNAKGETRVVAGSARLPGYADGPAADSRFAGISALALDREGNLYIADASNTIRRLSADGTVRTVAGTAGVSGAAPGPAPGVLGPIRGMAWSGNALFATVDNAVLKISFSQ